jgi:Tfp pilus assembly protein PilN
MSLRTNLATRPFYNERAVQAVLILVAVLVVVATFFNVWQLASLTRRDRALGAESHAADARAQTLRQQITQARSGLDGERLVAVAAAVREANAAIDGRTFSWTAVLNWLETKLPADVRISSITPRVDVDGRFILAFKVEGESVEAIDTFLSALEGTGRFDELLVRQERETDDGTIEANLEGFYNATSAPAVVAAGAAR